MKKYSIKGIIVLLCALLILGCVSTPSSKWRYSIIIDPVVTNPLDLLRLDLLLYYIST